jgi:putative ATP-binding cassette transporter
MFSALSRGGLERLTGSLDERMRWSRDLSLDEQQSLAFARLLLHKPRWALIDDALSALEPKARKSLMSVFDQELAGSAVISTGRPASENGFYGRTLYLRRCPRGAPVAPASAAPVLEAV